MLQFSFFCKSILYSKWLFYFDPVTVQSVERHTAISQGVTVCEQFLGPHDHLCGPSRHFDSSQIRGRYFNADCATHLSSRPGAIYQQDNARPHTARLSQQCLQEYDVLPWPARSPDLSPIEHVWTRWEGNCSRRDTGELTAQMQRLWQDLHRGHKYHLNRMPREFRLV
ncbi:uncharacterized protein TNCV_808531 [Trichonephila clavipes]|nr:uncharacterized protein TNCV_808531 [Trichonephila clavipes]